MSKLLMPKPRKIEPPKVQDPIEMPSQTGEEYRNRARLTQIDDQKKRRGRASTDLVGGGAPQYSRTKLG